MKPARRNLNSRSRAERAAIAMLRLACQSGFVSGRSALPPGWTTGEAEPFERLAAAGARFQLHILPPEARFITGDEVRTIGWIAQRQRSDQSLAVVDADFDSAAIACAAVLKQRHLHLPCQAVFAAFADASPIDIGGSARPLPARNPASPYRNEPPRRGATIRPNGVRARALALLAERKVLALREFERAGISRQNVSRMCIDGLIVRIGYGRYGDRSHVELTAPAGEAPPRPA